MTGLLTIGKKLHNNDKKGVLFLLYLSGSSKLMAWYINEGLKAVNLNYESIE